MTDPILFETMGFFTPHQVRTQTLRHRPHLLAIPPASRSGGRAAELRNAAGVRGAGAFALGRGGASHDVGQPVRQNRVGLRRRPPRLQRHLHVPAQPAHRLRGDSPGFRCSAAAPSLGLARVSLMHSHPLLRYFFEATANSVTDFGPEFLHWSRRLGRGLFRSLSMYTMVGPPTIQSASPPIQPSGSRPPTRCRARARLGPTSLKAWLAASTPSSSPL